MVNFVAVTKDHYAAKRWRRSEGYAFAAAQTAVPVMGTEFPHVALCMPIAFVEQAGRYVAVGVMSVVEGRNLFVGPNGQWLAGYLPAALRNYPFGLARTPGEEDLTLSVDEESGLVVDSDDASEPFFAPDGSLAPALNGIVEFLRRFEYHRNETDVAVAGLAEAGLIQPWSLSLAVGKKVQGLYRVDEAALKTIDDATFLRLRKLSAIPLAYMQLLSMNQVATFERWLALHEQVAKQKAKH
jgi:SapC